MAKITNKVVTVPLLGTFKEETDKIYVGQEALTTKLNDYVQSSSLTEQLADYAQTSSLSEYLKKAEIDTELEAYVKDTEIEEKLTPYAKTADIEGTYATKSEMAALGTIQGSCQQSELEEKKQSSSVNDCWIVTDDDNHLYYYNGEDFVDTNAKCDVDLTPYLKSETADSTYAKQTDLQSKADKSELDAYMKVEDLTEATEEDIKGLFSPAV